MYKFEQNLLDKGHEFIAGCDEVGRGPLAGPVVAAAVILDPNNFIEGLNDSKKLTEKKRELLDVLIKENALAYKIIYIWPNEIDKINIYEASRKAMIEAIKGLDIKPTFVLSDAMPLPTLGIRHESIIKGDSKSASIAAASIIAKVERDEYMKKMAITYPGYDFENNKGYPTKKHIKALDDLGITPIHRKSYKPVTDIINKQMTLEL